MTVTNSIVYFNGGTQIVNSTGAVTYSDIQGSYPGAGNIDVDPLFADAAGGDYHLKSQAGRWHPGSESWITDDLSSPCIDAGDPASAIKLRQNRTVEWR
jgi:hypothetical protein